MDLIKFWFVFPFLKVFNKNVSQKVTFHQWIVSHKAYNMSGNCYYHNHSSRVDQPSLSKVLSRLENAGIVYNITSWELSVQQAFMAWTQFLPFDMKIRFFCLFCYYWNSCSAFYLDGLMSYSVLFISDWCAQINLVYHVTILIKEIKMFWLLLQPLSRNLSQKGSWWLSFWLAIPSPCCISV